MMRTCYTCLIEQPVENFYTDRAKPDGISTICKPCSKAAAKAYRLKNRDKDLARKARYRDEHREEIRQYNHNYATTNREVIRQKIRQWQKSEIGKLKIAERRRAWRLKNPEH